MSESVKTRIEALEAKASGDGKRCPTCGRFHDDEKERERLTVKAIVEFDWTAYERLFDSGLERELRP